MKIAISLAIGPLHKWGYQHTCHECIASQAEFADHIYLVQSTADATGVPELLNEFGNVTLISNPSTWHHKPGRTDEVVDIGMPMALRQGFLPTFHMRNLATGRAAAFDDGYKVVLSTHVNWYIPRSNVKTLRTYCEDFEKSDRLTGNTWMIAQLHDKLIGPASRNEGLCNLEDMIGGDEVRAYYGDLKWRHPPLNEIPDNVNEICVVDCSYNLLPSEFEGMQRRMYYPGYETFDWPTCRMQLASRMSHRNAVLKIPLDYWGEKIAAKSGPEFMGYQILQKARLI